jgi:hypothetical protein
VAGATNFSFACWKLQSCYNWYSSLRIFCTILVFQFDYIIFVFFCPTSLAYLHAEPIYKSSWSPTEFLSVQIFTFYTFVHSFSSLPHDMSKPLLKWADHIVGSRASTFRCEYPLLSLRSSSSFLRLLPCLAVTSILHFIFSSTTCRRRQFLRKIWPIQLAFRLLISCRIFPCSLTLSILLYFSSDQSNWSPSLSSTTFENFPGHHS